MTHGNILSDNEYKFFMSFLPYVYRRTLSAKIYLDRLTKKGSASKAELEALSHILSGSDLSDDLNTMMDMLNSNGHDEFYELYGGPDEIINKACDLFHVKPNNK